MRRFLLTSAFICLAVGFSFLTPSSFAFASFAPGETLDPGCAPTNSDCRVLQVNASAASGNFGISTTSPWGLFSINPSGISGPSFAIGSSTQTQFVVSTGGYVGIGTTTPGSVLSIGSLVNFTTATTTFYGTGGINLAAGCFAVGGTCISGSGGSGAVGSGTQGQFPFYNSSGTTLTATSSLFISQAGNVGVGTTSPYAKLSVVGEAVFRNFTATSTTATSTVSGGLNVGSDSLVYDFSSGITSIDDLQVGPMIFDTNAGAVAWIDMSVTAAAASSTVESYTARLDGNSVLTVYGLADGTGVVPAWSRAVGVATTSPWRTLSVVGTVAFDGLSTAVGTPDAICIDATTKEIVTNNASTCTVSSARFKHNIQSISASGLSIVNQLRPVTFDLNSNNESHYGFIAEEVALVDPRLIFNERGSSTTPRGVRYEEISAILVKAIQEQQAQIEALRANHSSTSVVGTLRVEERLCVDDVCMEKEQLKALIRSFGGATVSSASSSAGVTTSSTTAPVVE